MTYIEEIKNNPGVLPKVVVSIYRFGYRTRNIFFLYIIWKIIDTIFCKLFLNCEFSAKLECGKGLIINPPYGIVINQEAVIGKNVSIRHQVTIGEKNGVSPTIGDNVDISMGAKIIGGITIGNNCVIGANAVVTKSFPDNSILAGVPARIIKRREHTNA
ncbi:serine O-acetyltransferase [Enterococcus malodoratus]|uniref:serine O-acetyltransferase n=1 Tax=Enterococcus malodoratus TaxID=71451 RepID=UPI0039B0683F